MAVFPWHQRDDRHAQPRFHHAHDDLGVGRLHVNTRRQLLTVEGVDDVRESQPHRLGNKLILGDLASIELAAGIQETTSRRGSLPLSDLEMLGDMSQDGVDEPQDLRQLHAS